MACAVGAKSGHPEVRLSSHSPLEEMGKASHGKLELRRALRMWCDWSQVLAALAPGDRPEQLARELTHQPGEETRVCITNNKTRVREKNLSCI